jgi:putative tryptophan/tyrosine transport system substrate-binding protein
VKRRAWIGLGAAALALPAWSQGRAAPARIAWPASVPVRQWPPFVVFTEAMRERGWVEGRDYVVEEASYDGRTERIPAVVAEVVARKPDLIVGSGSPTMRPLLNATSTIPIVMFSVADPVGQGFVTSLARPGGNVTGTSSVDHGLLAKQFELLLQAAPRARHIGVLHNPDSAPHVAGLRDVEQVAARLGVRLAAVALRAPDGIDPAFESLRRERVDAVHAFLQPFMNTGNFAERLATEALKQRWPTALVHIDHARAGILLTYGWRNEDMVARLAYFVDRILKGTPPGDMAIEQPTRFYLVLNLKTARALGLSVPQSLMLRVDEVIQ